MPGRPVSHVCSSSYPAGLINKPQLRSFTGELGKITYISSPAVTRFSTQAFKDSFRGEKLIPSTESVHVHIIAQVLDTCKQQSQFLSYNVKYCMSYLSPAELPPPFPIFRTSKTSQIKACGTHPLTAAGGVFFPFFPPLLFLGASVPERLLQKDEKDVDNLRLRSAGHLFCGDRDARRRPAIRRLGVGLEETKEE